MGKAGACRHCGKVGYIHGRGLCWPHSQDKAVRIQYSVLPGGERSGFSVPKCIGCDAVKPLKKREAVGWVSVGVLYGDGRVLREAHCPSCVAEYGVHVPVPYITPEQFAIAERLAETTDALAAGPRLWLGGAEASGWQFPEPQLRRMLRRGRQVRSG